MIAGRYEVIRTLGAGAFGRTFLARDAESGRDVAIKALDARHSPDLKPYELFEREAVVLRSLRHQGIPEIYASFRDQWEGAEAAFLAMEYIEGTSLQQMIDDRRHLEPAEVAHITLELLGILEYLHGRVPPILHRDIKPSNIIIRPGGSPVLVDFGSVRNVFRSPEESGSTVTGTYGYMPYEQYMGQATPASDLFALGATLLHLLTGRAPPDFMTQEGRIEVPSALPGGDRMRALVPRLLKASPTERIQRAADARDILLATPSSTALAVPAALGGTLLPVGPRRIEGETRDLFRRATPGMWALMGASTKTAETPGVVNVLSLAFFSVLTAGILPIVFFSLASDRRRRCKPFFLRGVEATAVISSMQHEDLAFGEKMARVRYEFEAGGRTRRDADVVMPIIADRWRVGETVQVLYLPDRDYDSIIISTT